MTLFQDCVPAELGFSPTSWARLFKINDVVSGEVNFSNMPILLLKKCVKLLHCKSLSHFFSTKIFSVFGYKVVKHLTS